jgi:peptidoglycan/LPS O-acetylase OafA/YrhL
LESLRGIAMILVYLFHLDAHLAMPGLTSPHQVSFLGAFIRSGHTGVSLFFILSGFLLSLPFLAEARGERRVSRAHYFQRRALRILPIYYVAVVAGTLLKAQKPADLTHGLPYLAFLNAIPGFTVPLDPYSNVWWSLATEAQFYLLLPLLPLALRSRLGRLVGLLVLLAYAGVYGAFLRGYFRLSTVGIVFPLQLTLLGRAPLFLCGILVAWLYGRSGPAIAARLHRSTWFSRGGADAALLAVLALLSMLLQWRYLLGRPRGEAPPMQGWHVLEGILWGSALALVLMAPIRSKRLFCNRFFAYCGIVSYSMYLWHLPVIVWTLQLLRQSRFRIAAAWDFRAILVTLLISAICMLASTATYRLIERPFLARKARLG